MPDAGCGDDGTTLPRETGAAGGATEPGQPDQGDTQGLPTAAGADPVPDAEMIARLFVCWISERDRRSERTGAEIARLRFDTEARLDELRRSQRDTQNLVQNLTRTCDDVSARAREGIGLLEDLRTQLEKVGEKARTATAKLDEIRKATATREKVEEAAATLRKIEEATTRLDQVLAGDAGRIFHDLLARFAKWVDDERRGGMEWIWADIRAGEQHIGRNEHEDARKALAEYSTQLQQQVLEALSERQVEERERLRRQEEEVRNLVVAVFWSRVRELELGVRRGMKDPDDSLGVIRAKLIEAGAQMVTQLGGAVAYLEESRRLTEVPYDPVQFEWDRASGQPPRSRGSVCIVLPGWHLGDGRAKPIAAPAWPSGRKSR